MMVIYFWCFMLLVGWSHAATMPTLVQLNNYYGVNNCTGTSNFATFMISGLCTINVSQSNKVTVNATHAVYCTYSDSGCTTLSAPCTVVAKNGCHGGTGKRFSWPAYASSVLVTNRSYFMGSCSAPTGSLIAFPMNQCLPEPTTGVYPTIWDSYDMQLGLVRYCKHGTPTCNSPLSSCALYTPEQCTSAGLVTVYDPANYASGSSSTGSNGGGGGGNGGLDSSSTASGNSTVTSATSHLSVPSITLISALAFATLVSFLIR
jgi:hypothetical protein